MKVKEFKSILKKDLTDKVIYGIVDIVANWKGGYKMIKRLLELIRIKQEQEVKDLRFNKYIKYREAL